MARNYCGNSLGLNHISMQDLTDMVEVLAGTREGVNHWHMCGALDKADVPFSWPKFEGKSGGLAELFIDFYHMDIRMVFVAGSEGDHQLRTHFLLTEIKYYERKTEQTTTREAAD